MAKLPKSSRPDRRKPSATFDHPYQLNCFAPPIASTLREVGYVAATLIPIYAGLIYGYMSNAQPLGDGTALKKELLGRSCILAAILAFVIAVEVLRNLKAFDHAAFGRKAKGLLLAINLSAAAYALYALISLPALNTSAHHKRVQEKDRNDAEKRRKEEIHLAECNAQKAKDVDVLVKRRQAAYADHKKCLAEWVKPGLFSKETPEEACASKLKEHQQASANVKAREARTCATSSYLGRPIRKNAMI